jgi:hypothetical protein
MPARPPLYVRRDAYWMTCASVPTPFCTVTTTSLSEHTYGRLGSAFPSQVKVSPAPAGSGTFLAALMAVVIDAGVALPVSPAVARTRPSIDW